MVNGLDGCTPSVLANVAGVQGENTGNVRAGSVEERAVMEGHTPTSGVTLENVVQVISREVVAVYHVM